MFPLDTVAVDDVGHDDLSHLEPNCHNHRPANTAGHWYMHHAGAAATVGHIGFVCMRGRYTVVVYSHSAGERNCQICRHAVVLAADTSVPYPDKPWRNVRCIVQRYAYNNV